MVPWRKIVFQWPDMFWSLIYLSIKHFWIFFVNIANILVFKTWRLVSMSIILKFLFLDGYSLLHFFLLCLSQPNLKYKSLPAAFTIQPFLEPSLSVKKRQNKLSIYRLRVLVGKQSFRLLILMITKKGVCRKSGNV